MLGKAAHNVDGPARPLVFQHHGPQLRVGGVDRDVDGRDAQVDDPLHLPVRHIGQGQIVAQQKGQPGVVVLKIQAGPHPRGHLVHKAEDAVVGAGAGPVHQIGLELQPQVLPLPLAQADGAGGAVLLPQHQLQPGVIAEELIVQHVHDLVAVDVGQGLPHPQPRPVGRTSGVHRLDDRHAHDASPPLRSRLSFLKWALLLILQ